MPCSISEWASPFDFTHLGAVVTDIVFPLKHSWNLKKGATAVRALRRVGLPLIELNLLRASEVWTTTQIRFRTKMKNTPLVLVLTSCYLLPIQCALATNLIGT